MAEAKKKSTKKAPAKKAPTKKKAPTEAKAATKKVVPKKVAAKKVAPKYQIQGELNGKPRTLTFDTAKLRDAAFDAIHLRSQYLGDANMLRPIEVATTGGVVRVHKAANVVK